MLCLSWFSLLDPSKSHFVVCYSWSVLPYRLMMSFIVVSFLSDCWHRLSHLVLVLLFSRLPFSSRLVFSQLVFSILLFLFSFLAGGTNALKAPPFDYTALIFLPTFARLFPNIHVSLNLQRRGVFPRGLHLYFLLLPSHPVLSCPFSFSFPFHFTLLLFASFPIPLASLSLPSLPWPSITFLLFFALLGGGVVTVKVETPTTEPLPAFSLLDRGDVIKYVVLAFLIWWSFHVLLCFMICFCSQNMWFFLCLWPTAWDMCISMRKRNCKHHWWMRDYLIAWMEGKGETKRKKRYMRGCCTKKRKKGVESPLCQRVSMYLFICLVELLFCFSSLSLFLNPRFSHLFCRLLLRTWLLHLRDTWRRPCRNSASFLLRFMRPSSIVTRLLTRRLRSSCGPKPRWDVWLPQASWGAKVRPHNTQHRIWLPSFCFFVSSILHFALLSLS